MHVLQLKKSRFCFSLINFLNINPTRFCNFFTYLNEEALYFLLEHTKKLKFDINIYNNHIFITFFDGNIRICFNFLIASKALYINNSCDFLEQSPIYNVAIRYKRY